MRHHLWAKVWYQHRVSAPSAFPAITHQSSKEASQYADALVDKVVLVDGEALTNLMIEHGVGVSLDRAYEVKRLDSDYFNEV